MTTDPAEPGRPTGDQMMAPGGRPETERPGCASTWAWRRASARRTRCSRRRIAATIGARTWSWASSRHTAGATPRRCSMASRSSRAAASSTAEWRSRRWTQTRSSPRTRPVVLVDELAHTNVPGFRAREALAGRRGDPRTRHRGRQHVQRPATWNRSPTPSRRSWRTGPRAHPDEVVRAADEIELVDMSPHALRQRMRHGNVYPPSAPSSPWSGFFTEPNLRRCAICRCGSWPGGRTGAGRRGLPPGHRSSAGHERVMASRRRVTQLPASPAPASSLASVLHAPGSPWPSRRPRFSSRATAGRTAGQRRLRRGPGRRSRSGRSTDLARGLAEVIAEHRVSHVVLAHEPRRGIGLGRPPLRIDCWTPCPPEVHLVGEPAKDAVVPRNRSPGGPTASRDLRGAGRRPSRPAVPSGASQIVVRELPAERRRPRPRLGERHLSTARSPPARSRGARHRQRLVQAGVTWGIQDRRRCVAPAPREGSRMTGRWPLAFASPMAAIARPRTDRARRRRVR